MTQDQYSEYGELDRSGGRATLRFTRRLAHPPAKVWRALTEPEHLAAWFPTTIDGERAAGAKLSFAFRDMDMPALDGEMLVCDPPSLLELIWSDERLRFELTPDGDGTLLRFTASFDELGRAARDGAGWHACLDLMACDLSGQPGRLGTVGAVAAGAPRIRAAVRAGGGDDRAAAGVAGRARPGRLTG